MEKFKDDFEVFRSFGIAILNSIISNEGIFHYSFFMKKRYCSKKLSRLGQVTSNVQSCTWRVFQLGSSNYEKKLRA